MFSIKVTKKTKNQIDKTQAEILLKHQIKVGQAELLEKIVDNVVDNPQFLQQFSSDSSNIQIQPKAQKLVDVKITKRIKGQIRLFPEEWEE